ncbi:hypothetical protein DFH94DRAFT_271261 [Russula ochroleuca]|jgi:hypothetical protein|uniref:Uncharacterized protein n=1 Tax=Russula ochroleuca TaxID=152965 RepID=A0A9P5TCN8_9AGAM|nr:hypothetical protein DFH94DRAFT_271261 [Russula ochroleuca]
MPPVEPVPRSSPARCSPRLVVCQVRSMRGSSREDWHYRYSSVYRTSQSDAASTALWRQCRYCTARLTTIRILDRTATALTLSTVAIVPINNDEHQNDDPEGMRPGHRLLSGEASAKNRKRSAAAAAAFDDALGKKSCRAHWNRPLRLRP